MNTVDSATAKGTGLDAPLSRIMRTTWPLTAGVVVLIAAVAKLLVLLYASRHYGYFSDELYYLDCARHLAWGYVDQPPLIAVMTWLGTALWGESLPAIR